MMCYTKGSKKMLPAHWEGGASATLTNPLRGRKDWTPARARRKGGVGGIPPRPSVPPERSGGGQNFPQNGFAQSLEYPTNHNFRCFGKGLPRGFAARHTGFAQGAKP